MEPDSISAWGTVAGVVVALVALYVAWRGLASQRAPMTRTVDAKLWLHLGDVVEARVTLHNRGSTVATVDKIRISRPRGAKVAWQIGRELGERTRSLLDAGITNVHDTRIIANPGQSLGCGMVIQLPRPMADVDEVRFECRLSASDQWRKYRWIKCRAMMTSAVETTAYLRARDGDQQSRFY